MGPAHQGTIRHCVAPPGVGSMLAAGVEIAEPGLPRLSARAGGTTGVSIPISGRSRLVVPLSHWTAPELRGCSRGHPLSTHTTLHTHTPTRHELTAQVSRVSHLSLCFAAARPHSPRCPLHVSAALGDWRLRLILWATARRDLSVMSRTVWLYGPLNRAPRATRCVSVRVRPRGRVESTELCWSTTPSRGAQNTIGRPRVTRWRG